MVDNQLNECRIVCIFAPADAVIDLCGTLGSNGYLLDSGHGLNLITSKSDAEKAVSHFGDCAFIRDTTVKVSNLPKGIVQLIRKKATTSNGKIDGWKSGDKIWGWFHPAQVPGRKIRIFHGETLIAEVEANIFRVDLFEAGVSDGVAGFVSSCPVIDPIGPAVTIRNVVGEILGTVPAPEQVLDQSLLRPARNTISTPLLAGGLPKRGISGHYSAILDGFSLDYFISTGTKNRMIVFSPGFLDTRRYPYPYFQRMKWAEDFEETCIFLADPTLLLGNTQIGWFIGDKKTHYLPTVAKYLGSLAKSHSIPPQNITFFGSSAGGFSSIGLAAHLRGARALAVNPQTNALKLHSPSQLAATLRSCLEINDLDEAYRKYAGRFVLSEMFRQLGNVPRITIWQNFYDRYHLEHHLIPFINGVKDMNPTETIEIHMAARPDDGHDPPDLPVIRHLFGR